MITEWLIQLVGGIAAALVSLLPSMGWEQSDFADASNGWGISAAGLNAYIPVTTMFTVAGLLVLVWVGMAAWNGIVWLYHQFWGSS